MKHVILKSLTLINFKGEKKRTTNFNADITTISGANGLGKTRHMDAFLWLLFGKDKENRADYEIKTKGEDGESIPEIDVVVTGILTVGGETIELTRKLVENWVTPRMSKERVFKGNETRCFWNGVPVTVTDYKERVNNIIDENLFKMVTNPMYFATMDWKVQREQLFAMAGRVDDAEIAANNADFSELLKKMSGKSFDDYNAEIRANKTNLRKEMNEIQPRIDQTEKMKPEAHDWAALEKELNVCNDNIAKIDSKIAKLNRAINDRVAAANAKFEETKQMRRDIMNYAVQMESVVNDAVLAEKKRVQKINVDVVNMENTIEQLIENNEFRNNTIASYSLRISNNSEIIAEEEKKRNELRTKWYEVNQSVYDEVKDKCPTCHQPMPESSRDEFRARFAEAKRAKLESITNAGKSVAENIDNLRDENTSLENRISTLQKEIDDALTSIAELKSNVEKYKVHEDEIIPENLPEWVELKGMHDKLSAQLTDAEKTGIVDAKTDDNSSEINKLNTDKAKLVQERDDLVAALNHRAMIDKADAEIAKLNEQGRMLAQQIADVERDEYIIGQFTKAKVDLVESRVAGLFKHVKFRMFNYTIDGNAIETCVAMVNGVPFPTVNSAMQINAGLDIINALCDYYDVTAPIFIDNRESVNTLIPTKSQIINLVVTTDPELIVS